MPTSLLTNQEAIIGLSAVGADGSQKPATLTATVAPYPGAHLSFTGGGSPLHFVADAPGSYTVAINGTASNGAALPTQALSFTVTAPAPPPVATAIVVGAVTVKGDDTTTPGDSGSATVSGTV